MEKIVYKKRHHYVVLCERTTVTILVFLFAVAVIYSTAIIPREIELNCDRPCNSLDWVRICRIKLRIEMKSFCHQENCTAKCDETSIFTINGRFQGPSINVCKNDILIVDVENRMPGQSVTIHWRGQQQAQTPFMDGVPMVTQCPISSHQTFQYKFRATQPGTHLYHAFSGHQRAGGVFGALVVKEPDAENPILARHEYEATEHTLVVAQFDDIHLVNGLSIDQFNRNLHVSNNKIYRFRLSFIRNYEATRCDIRFSIKKHILRVIAVDANDVVPFDVESLIMSHGERIDFLLTAEKSVTNGKYTLEILIENECSMAESVASPMMLDESSTSEEWLPNAVAANPAGNLTIVQPRAVYDGVMQLRQFRSFWTTQFRCPEEGGMDVCLANVHSKETLPHRLVQAVDKTIFLPIESTRNSVDYWNRHFVESIHKIGNVSFVFPPSPMFAMSDKIRAVFDRDFSCNQERIPAKCLQLEICNCVNLEELQEGEIVEIIIVNKDQQEDHVFHLHGHSFRVIGSAKITELNASNARLRMIAERIERNLYYPIVKDTIAVPRLTVVVVRFIAANPGFWLWRDENARSWTRGLDVLLHVQSSSKSIKTPPDFPTCENYVGPKYFFI